MLRYLENVDLSRMNTFGIRCHTRHLIQCDEEKELIQWLAVNDVKGEIMILGQGSNILFTRDYPGTIIQYTGQGFTASFSDPGHVIVDARGGMVWDHLVEACVNNGWGGIENLSLIPGLTGAAPVQNIGAYGCEVKDVIEEVRAVSLENGEHFFFDNKACRFGYRDSIFKTTYRNKLLITSVKLKLSTSPLFNTSYGNLQTELAKTGPPSLKNIRQAVINTRRNKLPDPHVLGNAGSFFKNPVVPKSQADELLRSYPGMPVYPCGDERQKLSAAWLIDTCGWKGKKKGDAGVHEKQALVIVNYGNAAGTDILALAETISKSVFEQFGVRLEREVTVV